MVNGTIVTAAAVTIVEIPPETMVEIETEAVLEVAITSKNLATAGRTRKLADSEIIATTVIPSPMTGN